MRASRGGNLEILEKVATALEEILPKIVFVGGMTVPLHIEDPVVSTFRATKDVDCIIEIVSIKDHQQFESKLRKKGFRHPAADNSFLHCRWSLGQLLTGPSRCGGCAPT